MSPVDCTITKIQFSSINFTKVKMTLQMSLDQLVVFGIFHAALQHLQKTFKEISILCS